jgi:hypothetical protein
MNEHDKNMLIGLAVVLVVLWIVLWAIPSLFVLLFHSTLGNLAVLALIGVAGYQNWKLGLGFAVVFLILYRFAHMIR